ncbi:TPA_asm: coat protein [ssRNA phage SRR5466725_5]|uniref:Coat protein n=1 Tax=ssRNA phage SRR5466725_5 TaxID=2786424 RepID=A0A8S5KZS4_9VIRU|nr:coat protein [ssRNA phage SRR5466725_5]DAD50816.1 TPA_asm: coat protein [ssRNA phage SRR5466725_5]
MAKNCSAGYTDTPISGVASLNFPRGLLNFEKDFRVKSNSPGKEVILTNITCPTDQPEKLRLCFSEVSNIYAGTGIDAPMYAPSKKGVSILAQLTDVISVTDTVDSAYRVDLPCSYHLVIKVPSSAYVQASDVVTGIGRLLSGLFDTGVSTTSRLDAILRGSLVPQDV